MSIQFPRAHDAKRAVQNHPRMKAFMADAFQRADALLNMPLPKQMRECDTGRRWTRVQRRIGGKGFVATIMAVTTRYGSTHIYEVAGNFRNAYQARKYVERLYAGPHLMGDPVS